MELHPETPSGNFDYAFRLRYETLRALLNRNGYALQLLSDLEADLRHLHFSDHRIKRPVERLLGETLLMAQELNLLSRNRYTALYEVIDQLHRKIDAMFQTPPPLEHKAMVIRLDGEDAFDSSLVGGKSAGAAGLRSLFPELVPSGFTVTTSAYRLFLKENGLSDRIRMMLKDLDAAKDRSRFSTITESIRNMIRSANTPKAVSDEIVENARSIIGGAPSGWAVRSSATSEDSRFSFAGQFESLLKVSDDELINAYKEVLASRFTDRAVIYRLNCGFREVDTPMAVLFMPMIDPVAAGVLYTADPEDPDADRMVLVATPGLSAAVVKGMETPDTFFLSRQPHPVLLKSMPVARLGLEKYLFEESLSEIAALGFRVMSSLGFEMDIEWAVDKLGKVWLLQGRRLYHATREQIKDARAKHSLPLIEGGATIFPGRAEGPVIFRAGDDARPISKGSVLVVSQPTPELATLLSHAASLLA